MPGTNENTLEAQGLLPTGETAALDIRLNGDERLCLIGPDSGRLCHYLRTLAGVEIPQQGELTLLGTSPHGLDRAGWYRQRQGIGFVSRHAPILSVLRGLDNVMLPALYHKRLSRAEAEERATTLLTQLGFDGEPNTLPAYLTSQQRLQLAIARATILEPQLLVMEQPFSDLSLAERQPIYHYLTKVWQRTLIVTTHDLRLVEACGSRILFVGQQRLHHFADWQALANCDEPEVKDYLDLYPHYGLNRENA